MKINRCHPRKSVKLSLSNDPNLHTDLGPILCAFLSTNSKISIVEDLVYEKRNGYIEELKKLGFKIKVINNKIIIFPYSSFKETTLYGKDLRGSFALLMASLIINDFTYLEGYNYIKRGYEDLIKRLMRYNSNCRIISPKHIKERMISAIDETLANYL